MIRKCRYLFSLCLLALGATFASAQSAEELYRESGLEHELSQLPETLATAMKSEAEGMYGSMPESEFQTLLRVVPRAFSEEEMRDEIISDIDDAFTESERERNLQWLRSSVGRAMTELETRASNPEAVAQLQKYRAGGRINELSEVRLQLVRRYMEATDAIDRNVDFLISMRLGMIAGVLAAQPMERSEYERRLTELEKQLEQARLQLKEQLSERVTVNVAFTYRAARNEELREYTSFLETDGGRRYMEVTAGALYAALTEGARRFGLLLAEELGNFAAPEAS